MTSKSASSNYTNYYLNYRMNPNNFTGSNRTFVENHNANLSRSTSTDSNSFSEPIQLGSPSSSSSGPYMVHSYYGNCGHLVTSCVG